MKPIEFYPTRFPSLNKYLVPLASSTFLIFFVLACIRLILPEHALFGSQGDWFSQHVAVAEQYRKAFCETGNLLPDWLPLGAGSNSYDFSYYGFLRPDLLLSFLFPNILMSNIISGYAILELAAGTVLCYFWLKRHVTLPVCSLLGAMLYSCAACFFHAHRQIIFVNYMPFLLLALWGIEKLCQCGNCLLLTISIFLVCIHSYYFAPAVLIVCAAYFLHCLSDTALPSTSSVRFIPYDTPNGIMGGTLGTCFKFASSIGLALGMAAVLLLPTALDLLSTTKDAGTPASLLEIFSLKLDFQGMLYHPSGCGLTLLCLYTLFLSIRRKNTRILSIFLLLCLTWNVCAYVLSGFLYVRYKVLIPLLPLLLLLCVFTLDALFTEKERHSLPLGLLCLVPLLFADHPMKVFTDWFLMFLTFLLISLGKKYSCKKNIKQLGRQAVFCLLSMLLCIPSICFSIFTGQQENFIDISDNRQHAITEKELAALPDIENSGGSYRFENLMEPFANVNTQPLPGFGRTSMYCSITDKNYADFYYNTMRNPIRIRNRVALMTDANPFFSYLMGIRLIQADSHFLPLGYTSITDHLAENSQVLPMTYTSTSMMCQKEFKKLSFPYTLEAITRYTIVPEMTENLHSSTNNLTLEERTKSTADSRETLTAKEFMKTSKITPISLENSGLSDLLELRTDNKEETHLTIPVPSELESRLLILTAEVTSPKGKEVTIDINNIRNKLSGKNAPYPNHNHTFTWILSSNDKIKELNLLLSPGEYTLSHWKAWTMETTHWGNHSVQPLSRTKNTSSSPRTSSSQSYDGSLMAEGTAALEKTGCLVTSFPYRKGYKAYVNGKKTEIYQINQTFVGFPLERGTYEISIFYCPPGKKLSICISLLSWILFFSISCFTFAKSLRWRT